MPSVTVAPDPFRLVPYDASTIARLAREAAAMAGFPDDVAVALEVDEVLPHPLTGTFVDVTGGRVSVWMSGANFEDPKRPLKFQEELAFAELVRAFLRAADRLRPEFAGAGPDEDLTDRQRAAWDVWTEGRAQRLGVPGTRPDRLRYHYRLHHGFNDVADDVFDRLWAADALAWTDLEQACAETDAADTRSRPKKTALRKEQLRAPRPAT
ncbi:MAG: hypothetical protein JOZ99_03700 [Actinobacteria bacterium]|nr:hypothetical protein [Actinomycetota bacterium]